MTFRITFSPVRSDEALKLAKIGSILMLNGDGLDTSVIPEGATLSAGAVDSPWIVDSISRIDGVLHLTIRMPHGYIPFPPPPGSEVVTFPQPITVTDDGPIDLPSWTQEAAE